MNDRKNPVLVCVACGTRVCRDEALNADGCPNCGCESLHVWQATANPIDRKSVRIQPIDKTRGKQ